MRLGTWLADPGSSRASFWDGQKLTQIPLEPRGINAFSAVAGVSREPWDQYSWASLWTNGVLQSVGIGRHSHARAINDGGEVLVAGGLYGVELYLSRASGGAVPLGIASGLGADLNNRSQVVSGQYLWQDGRVFDLNSLLADRGWTIGGSTAINDQGLIAVHGRNQQTAQVGAVLLSPVR